MGFMGFGEGICKGKALFSSLHIKAHAINICITGDADLNLGEVVLTRFLTCKDFPYCILGEKVTMCSTTNLHKLFAILLHMEFFSSALLLY